MEGIDINRKTMTNEEKVLLLKDLCARLPYGVKISVNGNIETLDSICDDDGFCFQFLREEGVTEGFSIKNIKPYLRPMDSMTEEEKKEFTKVLVKSQDCSYENNESATTIVNDWYLSKGFDVRGLIPKGLALEATEDMYK